MPEKPLPASPSEEAAPPSGGKVRYIVHPTPPDAAGRRKLCAHVVTQKTYSMEEFAEAVAQNHRLLDTGTVLHVLQCAHETMTRLLRSGNSIAFKNRFTLQLSISGALGPGEAPDPARGNQLQLRVRVAPALIETINQGIAFEACPATVQRKERRP